MDFMMTARVLILLGAVIYLLGGAPVVAAPLDTPVVYALKMDQNSDGSIKRSIVKIDPVTDTIKGEREIPFPANNLAWADNSRVWVSIHKDEADFGRFVYLYNVDLGFIEKKIRLKGIGPMTALPWNDKLYVSVIGTDATPNYINSGFEIYSLPSLKFIKRIDLGDRRRLGWNQMVMRPSEALLYASTWSLPLNEKETIAHLFKIDAANGLVMNDVTGGNRFLNPGGMAALSGNKIYLTVKGGPPSSPNEIRKGRIIIFDSKTFIPLGHINVSPFPFLLTYSPFVDRAAVFHRHHSDQIEIIDCKNDKIIKTISVGEVFFPANVGRGKIYLAVLEKKSKKQDAALLVLDMKRMKVIKKIKGNYIALSLNYGLD